MSDPAIQEDQLVDADADRAIRECLSLDKPTSFFLYAGAGSGKTRSLVEALREACVRHRRHFSLRNQRIAVITYTNKARDEIDQRLEYDPHVEVATIHAFAWSLIKGFDADIRDWLRVRLAEDIADLRQREARGRGGKASLERLRSIESKTRRLERLDAIRRFVYSPTSDNRTRDSLNHAEVIAITADFLEQKAALAQLLVTRFPILLIDESQDTTKRLMDALLSVAKKHAGAFTLGLFGDTMQRIYADGKEDLAGAIPHDWKRPEKVMNFRCPRRVIELINAIRSGVDDKKQRARSNAPEGVVRVFITGFATGDKAGFEANAAQRMAEITGDENWTKGDEAIKTLALEHLMAARRFAFDRFFEPLYYDERLRTGLLDGTASGIGFLLNDVLPLAEALGAGDKFAIASVVRRISPLLDTAQLAAVEPHRQQTLLDQAREGAEALGAILAAADTPTIQHVLEAGANTGIFAIPESFAPFVSSRLDPILLGGAQEPRLEDEGETAGEDEEGELEAWSQALTAPFPELGKYARYVRGLSQFDTHQGVKGLEFPRVMVVINDDEARGFMFNYGKLLGTHEKSDTDRNNEAAGKETSIDRTRRLFYVTCSRAEESLAIVYYAEDPTRAKDALLRLGWFRPEEIEIPRPSS